MILSIPVTWVWSYMGFYLFRIDNINGTDWGSLSLRKKGNSWSQTQKKIMQDVNSPSAFLPQRSMQVLGAAKWCVCLDSKGRHMSSITFPPYNSSLGVTLSVGNCGIHSHQDLDGNFLQLFGNDNGSYLETLDKSMDL